MTVIDCSNCYDDGGDFDCCNSGDDYRGTGDHEKGIGRVGDDQNKVMMMRMMMMLLLLLQLLLMMIMMIAMVMVVVVVFQVTVSAMIVMTMVMKF